MDELMQYIMDEGRVEGRKEGRAEGRDEGRMDVIRWMMDHPDSTPEQAMEKFGFAGV